MGLDSWKLSSFPMAASPFRPWSLGYRPGGHFHAGSRKVADGPNQCRRGLPDRASGGIPRRRPPAARTRRTPLHRQTKKGSPPCGNALRLCDCAVVWRRAFQSSLGGVCYYPMDGAAGLMGAATPKFAQMVSRKLVELPAGEVVRDVRENHARKVTVDFVQNLTGLVGALAAVTVPAPLKQCRDPPRAEAIKVISIQSDLHRRGWSLCADEPARGGSQARRSTQGTHAGMAHCHGWGQITLHDAQQVRQGTFTRPAPRPWRRWTRPERAPAKRARPPFGP